ncbi:MAG TPA: response regulator, partial [Methanotrichaceae archaeon]|nr:response regulator [Methanotrichaceae archaeon]
EIQDTGPGIQPGDLGAIFEPFIQSSEGKKSREGSGLGLAISQQFVRLMGGEISVTSQVGAGSLFAFEISARPVAESEMVNLQNASEPRAIGLEPGQPIYRLLIVEDSEENRLLLVRMLSELGFEVRTASNGSEGIEVWQEWQPHLIWMDMRMPIMDGHAATKSIKATTQGQATVIVALTASAFEAERSVVLSEGCDDFIRKPFRQEEIVDVLSRHLGVRFIYEDPSLRQSQKPMSQMNYELRFDGLDDDWISSLKQAAMEANSNKIKVLADQIREIRPELASSLAKLADNFDHDVILSAIQEGT